MKRSRARRPTLVGTVVGGLLATTGCSLLGLGPDPEQGARELADALTAGRLDTVSFTGGTSEEAQRIWDRSVAGLGDSEPTVEVDEVTEGDGDEPSTARLSYRWRLVGTSKPWTYRTTARLFPGSDDGWRVRLAPTLVHPDLRVGERLRLTRTFADRADILGAGGTKVVTEREVQRFGIDKTAITKPRQSAAARSLATTLGVDVQAYVEQVAAAGDEAFVEALVLREAAAAAALRAGAGRIRGVRVVRDTMPLAPTREFARPVLGSVGPVTAEIVKKLDGVYRAGDEAGLSGLQARYDEQLRGTPGATVDVVPLEAPRPESDAEYGSPEVAAERELFSDPAVAGEPLRTTIDTRLQRLAEETLSGVRPASAVVALRPSTGDLLAVASGLSAGGLSTATVGQYAPGSTFKVVSSLALLRSGLRPTAAVTCPATTVVDGKRFKNYDDYPTAGLGRIPFSTAVAYSCNTAFINERDAASQADLADAAGSLGLGVDQDLGFPAYLGSVPRTDAEAGSETGHAAAMIGQGKVVASPLAMAAVAASVAEGRVVVPRLLPDRELDATAPAMPLTGREADQLRTLMRGVVARGSGSSLADLPGPPVLAKTGTAEFGDAAPLRTHAWMIGMQGDLAVAVFVEVGDSGSGTAGPILERFLRGAVSRRS